MHEPAPSATTAVQRKVVPSQTSTSPEGAPAAGAEGETVTTKVTSSPETGAPGSTSSATEVAPACTERVPSPAPVKNRASPAYVAVTWCVPTARSDVAQVATPPASGCAAQSVVAPSVNVTVPVGTPVAGAIAETVAVKVTASPVRAGAGADATVTATAPASISSAAAPLEPAKLASPE